MVDCHLVLVGGWVDLKRLDLNDCYLYKYNESKLSLVYNIMGSVLVMKMQLK